MMSLLVPENHGLVAGSKVKFRGMITGDVRDVTLAADGRARGSGPIAGCGAN